MQTRQLCIHGEFGLDPGISAHLHWQGAKWISNGKQDSAESPPRASRRVRRTQILKPSRPISHFFFWFYLNTLPRELRCLQQHSSCFSGPGNQQHLARCFLLCVHGTVVKEGTRLSARVRLAREPATALSNVTGGGRERGKREGGRDGWGNKALRFQSLNSFVFGLFKIRK